MEKDRFFLFFAIFAVCVMMFSLFNSTPQKTSVIILADARLHKDTSCNMDVNALVDSLYYDERWNVKKIVWVSDSSFHGKNIQYQGEIFSYEIHDAFQKVLLYFQKENTIETLIIIPSELMIDPEEQFLFDMILDERLPILLHDGTVERWIFPSSDARQEKEEEPHNNVVILPFAYCSFLQEGVYI